MTPTNIASRDRSFTCFKNFKTYHALELQWDKIVEAVYYNSNMSTN